MNPKDLGLAFCRFESGGFYLQYFVSYRFEERKVKGLGGGKRLQTVLIITKPNGKEIVITDVAMRVEGHTYIYRASGAIYRYPKGER